jgi:putative hydrolase of the HAD superfamily
MAPSFLYFDLGNVVLYFDQDLACRQMAAVAGLSANQVDEAVFTSGLEREYELGAIDDRQFYEAFCNKTGARPDMNALLDAGSDIFKLNVPIMPVIAGLDSAGYRLGLLSNTCAAHWNFCGRGRFGILRLAFHVYALSFQIGACKPDPKIFAAAAQLAGEPPERIFFVDDIPGHVTAAREAGFDAVHYTGVPDLVEELRARGLKFNY